MQQRTITTEEIENQSIYHSTYWMVLLPEHPVSPYHFLIIPNRDDANHFTDILDDELIDLRLLVGFLTNTIENSGALLTGYNLFSNNGTYEIGQHLSRFHQHIFVRIQDEIESPYVVMADGRRWVEAESKEWAEQRSRLRSLFSY